MKLRELLVDLFNARPLHRATQANYRRAVVYFENHVGREAVVSDLTNRSVNSWLAASETEYPGSYVASLRRDLLVVWNFAADCGLCQHPKGRLIRRPTVERKPASAWPNWWIPRLIEACQELPEISANSEFPRLVYGSLLACSIRNPMPPCRYAASPMVELGTRRNDRLDAT